MNIPSPTGSSQPFGQGGSRSRKRIRGLAEPGPTQLVRLHSISSIASTASLQV